MCLEFSCTCSDSSPPQVHLWWIFILPRNNAGFFLSFKQDCKQSAHQLSISCLCWNIVLGVFLTNQALKTPLALLILSLFRLENIYQFIQNSANFQFFFLACFTLKLPSPCWVLTAWPPFLLFTPPSLQTFLSSTVHLNPEAVYGAVFLNSRLCFLLPC